MKTYIKQGPQQFLTQPQLTWLPSLPVFLWLQWLILLPRLHFLTYFISDIFPSPGVALKARSAYINIRSFYLTNIALQLLSAPFS
jgi:hypothetical protein